MKNDKVLLCTVSLEIVHLMHCLTVTKCLPPDVMHVLLEGVLPLAMKLVICKAHNQKHITIHEINDELKNVNIWKNDRPNKPVPLTEKDPWTF